MRYENQISIHSSCHSLFAAIVRILPPVMTMIPAEELMQRLAKFVF